jgi:hypothetical protein
MRSFDFDWIVYVRRRDPIQINPSEKAFYYVRILENPTCSWSTYDAIKTKSKLPEGCPATIQERAWSSPVWYEPNDSPTLNQYVET